MKINEMPNQERPREKLLRFGAESLNDAELLAIFLRSGIKGRNVIELSYDLISQFGGLRQMIRADKNSLCSAPGVGDMTYILVQAALELGKRHIYQQVKDREKLISSTQAVELLKYKLRDFNSEVFAALYLNAQNCIIDFEILFYGSITHTNIHPREIVRKCLQHNASAVVFSHNHPSGGALPSEADIIITKKLITLLNEIDIKVLDHIIIGDNNYYTFSGSDVTRKMFACSPSD